MRASSFERPFRRPVKALLALKADFSEWTRVHGFQRSGQVGAREMDANCRGDACIARRRSVIYVSKGGRVGHWPVTGPRPRAPPLIVSLEIFVAFVQILRQIRGQFFLWIIPTRLSLTPIRLLRHSVDKSKIELAASILRDVKYSFIH